MNKIFILLILSCLVITGQLTTTCNRCWNIGSTECCDKDKLQCDGSGCMTSSEHCHISGVDYHTIKKGCKYPQICDQCFSVTTNDNFLVRVSNKCGEGDESNAELNYDTNICDLQLKPNKYQCPSCFIDGSTDVCLSTGFVDCLGFETECVDYGGRFIFSGTEEYPTIQKGCSVPLLCGKCFSVTTKDNFLVRVSGQCGEGDGSNENLNYKDICDTQLQPNNYQCPSCFSIGSPSGCESTGYVDCLGSEKECFDYGAFLRLSDGKPINMSIKGCLTTGGCDIGYAGVPGSKELQRDHMSCTPAIKKD